MERETKIASGQMTYRKLSKNLDIYKEFELFSDHCWSCMKVEEDWTVVQDCLRGERQW